MINLLPPDIKNGYRFARLNVTLRHWVFGCLVALVGLGGIATYGLLAIQQSTNQYNNQIASQQALFKKEDYSQTQTSVTNLSNSFKLTVKVLSQEVLFSQLLKQIASIIPANTTLSNLQISQVQGAIDITAAATDYNAATQVQVNLGDPGNKIFSRADIISITCNSTTAINAQYPCTVVIRALFGPDTPYLFINSGGSKL